MPRALTHEADLLEPILARYEAEGFDVFVHPASSILPAFMADYRPDAIAIRSDKKIAFEIKRPGQTSDRAGQLQELSAQHAGWEFVVLYVSPRSQTETIDIADAPSIERAIREVEELKASGHMAAALMVGWSALEAIGRMLLPAQLKRSQPAAKLVEVLATEGVLTPSEADTLRKAAKLRNTAAHGQLDPELDPHLLDELVSALRTVSGLVPTRHRQ